MSRIGLILLWLGLVTLTVVGIVRLAGAEPVVAIESQGCILCAPGDRVTLDAVIYTGTPETLALTATVEFRDRVWVTVETVVVAPGQSLTRIPILDRRVSPFDRPGTYTVTVQVLTLHLAVTAPPSDGAPVAWYQLDVIRIPAGYRP